MDFMAQRVLYRNKVSLLLFFFAIVSLAYVSSKHKIVPSRWVNEKDVHLSHRAGSLYYNNSLFSGWIYSNFPNGNRYYETPFYNGREEGIMKSYYANHKPEQERLFVNGKKEGIHRGWWPDGKLKFEYYFDNDEHNGTAKEWFSNSTPYRIFTYEAGHEEGRQQMWWDNGTIRANYVVKDGKQYGLIGRKLCKNTMKNEKS